MSSLAGRRNTIKFDSARRDPQVPKGSWWMDSVVWRDSIPISGLVRCSDCSSHPFHMRFSRLDRLQLFCRFQEEGQNASNCLVLCRASNNWIHLFQHWIPSIFSSSRPSSASGCCPWPWRPAIHQCITPCWWGRLATSSLPGGPSDVRHGMNREIVRWTENRTGW